MEITLEWRRRINTFIILESIWMLVIFMFAAYSYDTPFMARQETVLVQQRNIVDTWQNVTGDGDMYVYSAYIEGTTIRIIGVTRRNNKENLFCQVWSRDYTDGLVLHTHRVKRVDIREHHSFNFTAAYFICNISGVSNPFAVSLTSNERRKDPRNFMLISGRPKSNYVDFAVCVAPIQSRYDQPYQLVEWIELHRLLGADRFIFYNYSSTSEVTNVLDYYISIGLVQVLPWSLPVPTGQIHYFGQLAAINECLFRNRDSAKYIVYVDLDEFIIPRRENVTLWKTMMSELPGSNAYMFRHLSFREAFPGESENNSGIAPKSRLVTLSHMERATFILPAGRRSKMIVDPGCINMEGIHYAQSMIGSTHVVGPEIGILHHYRWIHRKGQGQQTDTTMLKYKSDLIGNVERAWTTLQGNVSKLT